MIKLNLLPVKVRAAEMMRLILALGLVVYVLAGLGVGFKWTQSKARVAAAQAEVDAVNAELNAPNLISTVQAVEKFTKDKGDEQAKASVVDTYRKQQVGLLRLLDALPDWTASGDVWLEHVMADNNSNKVSLEGDATSSLAFARFFAMLENEPLVKNLKMPGKTTPKVMRGYAVVNFKLEFTLETPR